MRKWKIPVLVLLACTLMALVDAVWQPGYIVKSVVKMVLFIGIPVFGYRDTIKPFLQPDKKGLSAAVLLGITVYGIVVGGYLVFRNVFDFSALTKSLGETTGVHRGNFLWVAVYISFVNSFLEEFFFRGFSFITLKKYTSRNFALLFSSLAFSLYHIAMMIGWFGLPVILLSLSGLFLGGLLFNLCDEKRGSIYLSWLIHMFANFATNTIGFMLFSA